MDNFGFTVTSSIKIKTETGECEMELAPADALRALVRELERGDVNAVFAAQALMSVFSEQLQGIASEELPYKIAEIIAKDILHDRTPLDILNLSVRTYDVLKRAGLIWVESILELTEDDLLGVRNFGPKALDELKIALEKLGLIGKSKLTPFDDSEIEDFVRPSKA